MKPPSAPKPKPTQPAKAPAAKKGKAAPKPKSKPKPKPKAKASAKAVPPVALSQALGPVVPLPARFHGKLTGLIGRHLFLTLGEGTARLLLVLALLLLAQGAADWMCDLPPAVRALFLAADAAALGWIVRGRIVGAWRGRLTLETAALLAQKKWPRVRGAYVAAVQLAAGKSGGPASPLLVASLLRQVEGETQRSSFAEAFPAKPFAVAAALAVAAWAGVAAVFVAAPQVAPILLERVVLLPRPLPTRTIVEPVTKDLSAAIGSDVALEAKAVGVIPARGRISIAYGNETQELAPTPQGDRPGVFSLTLHNVQRPFRYRFSLNDGRGEWYNVKTLVAPTVASVECVQAFPAYTGLPEQKRTPSDLSLLAGSVLRLRIQSTLPLQAAAVVCQGIPDKVEMRLEGPDKKAADAELKIPAKGLTGFSFHLESQAGLASSNDTVYQVEIVPDAPPVVRIVTPEEPEVSITVKAKPKLVFEVSDDFALSKVRLCYEIGEPAPSANDEVPPPVAQTPVEFDLKQIQAQAAPGVPATLTYQWDVSAQKPPWREGDVINYWIEAVDNNDATGPGVTQSKKQHFSIVTPEVMQAETLKKLQAVTDSMHQMYEKEKKASDVLGKPLENKAP